jgi:hypothetical protein
MSRDFKYKNQLLNLLEKYVDKEITNLLLCWKIEIIIACVPFVLV